MPDENEVFISVLCHLLVGDYFQTIHKTVTELSCSHSIIFRIKFGLDQKVKTILRDK